MNTGKKIFLNQLLNNIIQWISHKRINLLKKDLKIHINGYYTKESYYLVN